MGKQRIQLVYISRGVIIDYFKDKSFKDILYQFPISFFQSIFDQYIMGKKVEIADGKSISYKQIGKTTSYTGKNYQSIFDCLCSEIKENEKQIEEKIEQFIQKKSLKRKRNNEEQETGNNSSGSNNTFLVSSNNESINLHFKKALAEYNDKLCQNVGQKSRAYNVQTPEEFKIVTPLAGRSNIENFLKSTPK